jgi:hypothetical protein
MSFSKFSPKFRIIIFLIVFPVIAFFSVAFFNQFQVSPTPAEIKSILSVFPTASRIKTKADIIAIQNQVFDSLQLTEASFFPIDIKYDLKVRGGICFNRSLLLQKILILNGFRIRPIYLFFSLSGKTGVFDFLKSGIPSHSIFEVKVDGMWFVVRTNNRMEFLLPISEYLSSPNTPVPRHTRYIRYLSNRHGKFIQPFFLPDIYGIF